MPKEGFTSVSVRSDADGKWREEYTANAAYWYSRGITNYTGWLVRMVETGIRHDPESPTARKRLTPLHGPAHPTDVG